ncbi:MAG: AsmA-like C-terminal region-containing protein, partial [Candidatus Binatia bacterium]
ALLFLIVLFIVYRLVHSGELRAFVISEIEKQTQLQVTIGEASLSLGAVVGISFGDFALLDPTTARPVMTAERVLARVGLLPLLRKKAVLYQLRVDRPLLQIRRDREGKIPVVDAIMRLFFEGQQGMRFGFDLHGISVEEGEVSFVDSYKTREPVVTRFRKMDLNLRRLGRWSLTEGISPDTQGGADQAKEKRSVEFRVQTAIEKGGERAAFTSSGKVSFPDGPFDLREAWLDADIRMQGFPASGFWEYYGDFLPVKSLKGTLSPRLRWQGRLAERVQVKGEIAFQRLEIEAPDIFAGAVSPGEGSLEFALDLAPQEIHVSRFLLRSKQIHVSAQGRVRSLGEEDPYLEIHVTTPFVPLVVARQYIPLRALKSPRLEVLVGAVNQGEGRVTKAGVSGRLSQIRRFSEPGFENHVWADAEIRGAGAELKGDRYLPLRGINGRMILEKGTLQYKAFTASYGQSQFTEIEGSHKGILTGQEFLALRVRGDLDLGQLRDQLRLALFPPSVSKLPALLQELSGRGKLALFLRTDLALSHQYDGRLSLENASLRATDLSFSQVKGEVGFSNKEVRAERIAALLAGSPLTVRGLLRNYLTDQATFDLGVDSPGVKAGAIIPILLSRGSLQDPGIMRGSIRYYGPVASPGERELSGSLELVGVQLQQGLFGRPMSDLSGRIKLDKRVIDVQALRGRISGYGFDFSGQWRYAEKPQLTFSLISPEMDLAYVLPRDKAAPEWYDRLQAKGKISIVHGRYEGFEFSGLKSDLTIHNRHWRLDNFSARSHGGSIQGAGVFIDHPVGVSFSLQPEVQGVPIEGFLKWFDGETGEITGQVNLTGNFDSTGTNPLERKRNLTGAFQLKLEDGVVRRFTVLVRILNLLDLSRWFSLNVPDLRQQGIRFRSVTGDFKIERGIYTTQNLFMDSDDLRLTGAGTLDGTTGEVNFVVAVRPFPGLDAAVKSIPLIGPGIAAIKNSLLVASFRV